MPAFFCFGRHCERSEAIHGAAKQVWIASAFALRATADKSSRSLLSVAYFARPKAQSDNSYQEQIQMIAAAIGTPKPSAPKVARTNSESRFAWGRASGNGMALLLEAPASLGSSPG